MYDGYVLVTMNVLHILLTQKKEAVLTTINHHQIVVDCV